MPIFDWDARPLWPHVQPSIWIYWVVSVPITATVLYVWRFWFIGAVQKQQKEDAVVVHELYNLGEIPQYSVLQRFLLRSKRKGMKAKSVA